MLAPIYLWQKSATPDWLGKNAARFDKNKMALIERPGRERVLLELTADAKTVAALTRAFGGRYEKLGSDYLGKFLRLRQTKPIRIGSRLLITNRPLANQGPQLVIPAGAAFGTGEHATTAMSLRLLERVTRRLTSGWRMLDAGTGSGILALAGSRFGACEILAVDNDPLAIATAQENARRNRIAGVEFIYGDVAQKIRGRFDVITANLYSELLVKVLPRLDKALARNGRLILSGVMRRQETDVRRALRGNGFAISIVRRRGKWIALLAKPSCS